jgi:hypothetical protein
MSEGHAIDVIAADQEVSAQDAADLLGVSRPIFRHDFHGQWNYTIALIRKRRKRQLTTPFSYRSLVFATRKFIRQPRDRLTAQPQEG